MSFWDNVNEELKRAAKEGWEAVKDSAKIGKNRYKVHTLHKKAEKLFAEIGGIVYDMAKPPYENPLSRPAVLKLIEDIKKIEQETTGLEEEIAKTRKKEAGEKKAAPPAAPSPSASEKEAGEEGEQEK